MATIYKTPRILIAEAMARTDEDRHWLAQAQFAKTSNGFWVAWRADDPTHIGFLEPDQPAAKPAQWLDARGDTDTLEKWVAYFESGEYEADPPGELNIFIEDSKTGRVE